jgi:hypothetical protein
MLSLFTLVHIAKTASPVAHFTKTRHPYLGLPNYVFRVFQFKSRRPVTKLTTLCGFSPQANYTDRACQRSNA